MSRQKSCRSANSTKWRHWLTETIQYLFFGFTHTHTFIVSGSRSLWLNILESSSCCSVPTLWCLIVCCYNKFEEVPEANKPLFAYMTVALKPFFFFLFFLASFLLFGCCYCPVGLQTGMRMGLPRVAHYKVGTNCCHGQSMADALPFRTKMAVCKLKIATQTCPAQLLKLK